MEIDLTIKYDELRPDGSLEADGLRRKILQMYPNSIWERRGEGHRIII